MATFQDEFSDDGNLGLGIEQGQEMEVNAVPPQESVPQSVPDLDELEPVKQEHVEIELPESAMDPAQNPVEKTEPPSTSPEGDAPGPAAGAHPGEMIVGSKAGSAVYIANLQWWTTDVDVERFCSEYGPVTNVQFLAERSNGKSKGVALVEFSDPKAAMLCKEGMSGQNIHGRTCVVTFPSQSHNRSGFGSRGGMCMGGPYDRMGGRMMDGRGRGRNRGYMGWDMRPGMGGMNMGAPDMPGYMHEMAMADMPMDMMGMPPMEGGPGGMMGGPGMHMPPPFPMPGR